MNRVIIVGNLGRDPELKETKKDSVVTLNVATNESWTDKSGEKHERVEWHRVVVWGKHAEACAKYLKKGSQVGVAGALRTREWEDKDGNKRYTTEIATNRPGDGVEFLGKATGGGSRSNDPGPENDPF